LDKFLTEIVQQESIQRDTERREKSSIPSHGEEAGGARNRNGEHKGERPCEDGSWRVRKTHKFYGGKNAAQ